MSYTHQGLTVEDSEKEYRFSVITEWKEGGAYLSNGARVNSSPNEKGNFEAELEVNKDMNGKSQSVLHRFSLEKGLVQAQSQPAIEAIVMKNGVELGRTIHALDSSLMPQSRSVDPKGVTTGAKEIKRPIKIPATSKPSDKTAGTDPPKRSVNIPPKPEPTEKTTGAKEIKRPIKIPGKDGSEK